MAEYGRPEAVDMSISDLEIQVCILITMYISNILFQTKLTLVEVL